VLNHGRGGRQRVWVLGGPFPPKAESADKVFPTEKLVAAEKYRVPCKNELLKCPGTVSPLAVEKLFGPS